MKKPRLSTSLKTHPIQDLSRGTHDAYRAKEKLTEGTCCPDCGAVFADGRWQWLTAHDYAPRERCPACMRIRDHFPAGYVQLAGSYVGEHRSEIIAIVRNLESKEKAEHPLQRVMAIEEDSGGMKITTTDIHLARAVGDALHHAHGGKLEIKYGPDDNVVRVEWNR